MIGRRVLLFAIGLAAPALAGAAQLRGAVVASAVGVMVVEVGNRIEVVQTAKSTELVGIERLDELAPGSQVEVEWSAEVGGVKVADAVVAPPRRTLVDRSQLVDAERVAAEIVGAAGTAPAPLAIDLRPLERFEEGHVPGALSVPLERISTLGRMAPDRARPLVVYSEDGRCGRAPRALRAALALGYADVRILEGGFAAWRRTLHRITIEPRGLARAMGRGDRLAIVDVRGAERAAAGSVRGAAAMGDPELDARRFAGRMVDPPVVLVGEDGRDPRPDEVALRIEGYRRAWESPAQSPVAVLAGGARGWQDAGQPLAPPLATIPPELADPRRGEIGAAEFDALWSAGAAAGAVLLDVRPARAEPPPGALHVPLEDLPASLAKLPKDRQVVVFCSVGRRSAIAYEILKKNGYKVRFFRGAPPR